MSSFDPVLRTTDDVSVELEPAYKKRLWMVRNCNWYDIEYSDCRSIRARFHQYFVHGSLSDCSQWQRDFKNCNRWEKDSDVDSIRELIDTEQKRRKERLDPFLTNAVWEKRESPPENWNVKLPEWMEEAQKDTFLALKAEELKENETKNVVDKRQSFCSIM